MGRGPEQHQVPHGHLVSLGRATACRDRQRPAPSRQVLTAPVLAARPGLLPASLRERWPCCSGGPSLCCRQGAGDNSVAPSHARWWAQAVPGSELHVVEGEGHVSLVGRHAARILQDMLDGSTAAPAPAAVAAPAAP